MANVVSKCFLKYATFPEVRDAVCNKSKKCIALRFKDRVELQFSRAVSPGGWSRWKGSRSVFLSGSSSITQPPPPATHSRAPGNNNIFLAGPQLGASLNLPMRGVGRRWWGEKNRKNLPLRYCMFLSVCLSDFVIFFPLPGVYCVNKDQGFLKKLNFYFFQHYVLLPNVIDKLLFSTGDLGLTYCINS